jgi:hypothetical protein
VSRVEPNRRLGRVRKSRQKEAAGVVDAGLMQIEWSEERVEVGGSRHGNRVRSKADAGGAR